MGLEVCPTKCKNTFWWVFIFLCGFRRYLFLAIVATACEFLSSYMGLEGTIFEQILLASLCYKYPMWVQKSGVIALNVIGTFSCKYPVWV